MLLIILKNRFIHSIFSACLAFLVLFGGTAKEFIHEFTGHTDTVHHQCDDGELSFENQHHHCDFLGDSLPPFYADATFPFIEFISETYFSQTFPHISFITSKERIYTSLRGPPAAV